MKQSLAPHVSIIIPAWNEARWLPQTLSAVRQACEAIGADREIIVVDNASSDATAELARQAGVRVVSEPQRRISRARNAGAAAARGRVFIFVDADTLPSAALLRATLDLLAGGKVCGGGAWVEFDRLNHAVYRHGTEVWNRLSAWLNLAAGCYLFCTREAFEAVGGFSERVYAGEEVFLSRRLARWGRRHGQAFRILDQPVLTSGRKAEWFSPWQHLLVVAMVLLFPPSLYSRRLSWFWYRRPPG